ncbi:MULTISPECIES: Lrp/AsnC family transcriptional regulator [Duganella]|jgi:DNA-binding Lrp family transcriptional regulator|uniref:Lrp/AsnC family transcriptional regulator n=1 Tax=Duganella TaxID=75654 RepID=UPI0030E79C91
MTAISVDRYDIQLLTELQRDGHATNSGLGEKVHLSASQISRRVQRLEEARVVDHYAAILDPVAVGLDVMVFTQVTMDRHNDAAIAKFEREVRKLPQILECFSLTGEADYLLRIVAPDLAAFSEFVSKHLLRLPGITNVHSNVTLDKVKQTHVLPLDHVMQPVESKKRIKFAP